MQYVFTKQKNCILKIDNSPQWKKDAAEKKRLRLQSELSVEDLIDLGFYNHKNTDNYGVDICTSSILKIDTDRRNEYRDVFTNICVRLPNVSSNNYDIKQLSPFWNQDKECFYWRYQINGNAMLWVALDILNRIFDFMNWDAQPCIPLYWNIGNEKCLEMVKKIIPTINNRTFNVPIPKVVFEEDLELATKNSLLKTIPEHQIKITTEAKIAFLRHQYTPYDYLWETKKMTRDNARKMCNSLILPLVNG